MINKQNLTGGQSSQNTSAQGEFAMLSGKICLLANAFSNGQWLIDSGATDHICSNLNMFISYKPVNGNNDYIVIPDGRQVPILHVGSVKIQDNLILHDVLHIPLFQFNLISVQKLCKDLNCTVLFDETKCVIQDHLKKGRQLLLGNSQGGLYSTPTQGSKFPVNTSLLAVKEDLNVWHLRLGHVPFDKLKSIPDLSSLKHKFADVLCQICPLSRQTRIAFPNSQSQTTHYFELIHIDVWGPYKVKAHNGCNQFLTIVDDFSRFTWVHMMKFRTDCVKVLTDFFAHVETQYKVRVQKVRFDNAPELCQGALRELFLQQRISHQTSCSYTPQQNGLVERKHRHFLETTRSLYFHSKIPAQYWNESVLCATYIINRLRASPKHWQ